jgi:hypothetical protein
VKPSAKRGRAHIESERLVPVDVSAVVASVSGSPLD